MSRGNVHKLRQDAEQIKERLQKAETSITALAREYHTDTEKVRKFAHSLFTPSQWKMVRIRILANGGKKTRWKKGDVPWNKNIKGLHMSPATEFKKGQTPKNILTTGTITIRTFKDGFRCRFIKIKGKGHQWDIYARYLWKVHYGQIPKDYCVVHLDGDSLNDDIKNLRCMSRAEKVLLQLKNDPACKEQMRRNSRKAVKKRWARYRKEKIIAKKLEFEKKKRLKTIKDKMVCEIQHSYWECTWCGHEFSSRPAGKCPVCDGIYFEKRLSKAI